MAHEYIYHLCQKTTWQEALKMGEYFGSALDLKDGFIHFSTADQIVQTVDLHLTGVEGLVMLKVPTSAVTDSLIWEKSRDGVTFPHLYRTLKCDEAIDVTELELDKNNRHVIPRLD
ncbi:MAG: DUF952 domain-containing protein [Pseudomonadota bacterium]|nr:DUF952 domain-containing protein [Pseudomonadota bacterium]